MQLRFLIPCEIYLFSFHEQGLDVYADFMYKGYSARLSLPGGEVVDIKTIQVTWRFMRRAEGLQLVLCDRPESQRVPPLSGLLPPDRRSDLLQLIRRLGSRVCKAIRNFGMAPELPERLRENITSEKDIEACLRKWKVEVSEDGKGWQTVLEAEANPYAGLLAGLFGTAAGHDEEFRETVEIKTVFWDDIVEALEERKEPPPESEFVTNTIGHMRKGNYRLAVVESVIGLEIVLAQFLRAHLSSRGVPKDRIDHFLLPEVGLTARLSALLNLTLHESYLADVDLDKVLRVVRWRNDVVHKSGRVFETREELLRDSIWAVVSLVQLLAERRDDIEASPELRKVTEALRERHHELISYSLVWLRPRHSVRMDVMLYSSAVEKEELREKLEKVATEAAELLKLRDPRFERDLHLTIHFKTFPETTVAWFRFGRLDIVSRT
ncbi:MAG: hypothetical protein HYY65_01435 [Candidatus Tectomicrobia bacterium]|uniref:Uncharacterized protein n=1 Tax=Tectimicrobiota bacterium TaxID=2528274 RepID=A0A932GM91_UNCTE|nr:hypothetical protein [Candidatus Tectomicrobia bacterium]